MKLEFELVSPTEVKIFSVRNNHRKEIGQIFTPSGSGGDTLNAIQVCGFTEAFDLWGCGVFGRRKLSESELQDNEELTKKLTEQVNVDVIMNGTENERKNLYQLEDDIAKLKEKHKSYIQAKDIQLVFDERVELHHVEGLTLDNCHGCFNKPCTCDKKDRDGRKGSPYLMKKRDDLSLEKKSKYMQEMDKLPVTAKRQPVKGKLKNATLGRAEDLTPETRMKHGITKKTGMVVIETREVKG